MDQNQLCLPRPSAVCCFGCDMQNDKLHLATTENTTTPECHRSRAEGQRACFVGSQSLKGGLGDQQIHWDLLSRAHSPTAPASHSPVSLTPLSQAPYLQVIIYLDLCPNCLPFYSACSFASPSSFPHMAQEYLGSWHRGLRLPDVLKR